MVWIPYTIKTSTYYFFQTASSIIDTDHLLGKAASSVGEAATLVNKTGEA